MESQVVKFECLDIFYLFGKTAELIRMKLSQSSKICIIIQVILLRKKNQKESRVSQIYFINEDYTNKRTKQNPLDE